MFFQSSRSSLSLSLNCPGAPADIAVRLTLVVSFALVNFFAIIVCCQPATAQVRYYRPPARYVPRYQQPVKRYQSYPQRYQVRPQKVVPQNFGQQIIRRQVPTPAVRPKSAISRPVGSQPSKATSSRKTNPPEKYAERPAFKPKSLYPRIAGDYEKQKAILISVCELLPTHEDVLVELVNACQGHVTVGILVNDRKQLIDATRVLMKQDREYDHIKFYNVELDTIWLRDFGPRIGELKNGEAVSFDFLYEGTRPRDERLPKAWSKLTRERYHAVPWTMQGGNLLFNGRGLALTTNRIFKDNSVTFNNLLPGTDPVVEAREMVTQEFKKNCNLNEIVILEPLRNEATRHVDMFAAFVAHNHVVVASLDRNADPVNAALLDRNVKKLKTVMVDGKPLKVTRIPTPARQGKYWSTFTNVIFANDLVILPSFDDNPRAYVERAVAVYKSILPDHTIKVINTTTLKKLEGSVHCMSINVPEFAKLPPKYLSLAKSIAWVKRGTPSAKQIKSGKSISTLNNAGAAR